MVAGSDIDRECMLPGPRLGPTLMLGPNRCLGFNWLGGAFELKNDSGSTSFLSAIDLPPLPDCVCMTSNNFSNCAFESGSSEMWTDFPATS